VWLVITWFIWGLLSFSSIWVSSVILFSIFWTSIMHGATNDYNIFIHLKNQQMWREVSVVGIRAVNKKMERRYWIYSSHTKLLQSLIHTISKAVLNRKKSTKRKSSFNGNLIENSIIFFQFLGKKQYYCQARLNIFDDYLRSLYQIDHIKNVQKLFKNLQ
jgi:hypothetical protein